MNLKVLCLNIWHGGKLRDPMLEFIKAQDADILLLQEVFEEVDLGLSYSHRYFAPEFLHIFKDRQYVDGNAIFSKYPITSSSVQFYFEPYGIGDETKRETYPFFPRTLQYAQIDVGGTTLNVYNTHGVWGEDGGDNERRLAVSEKILEAIGDKQNVMLGGDFNVCENTKSMLRLEDRLINVFKNERVTSFNILQKPSGTYDKSVVDFIFVSKDFRVVSHASPNVNISDHLPMVAVLDI